MINFTLEGQSSGPHINSCSGDKIRIDGRDRTSSVLLTPEQVLDWPLNSFNALNETHIAQLLEHPADVFIIGTGHRQHFPDTALLAPFMRKGLGVEIMDSGAAARTYNILMSEGRRPVAGIIIEPSH